MKSSACSDDDLITFVRDLIAHAKSHLTQNAIVIPIIQSFNILIGGDALDRLYEDQEGLKWFVGGTTDSKMVLNACLQPSRASCPRTAKCSSPEEC
jgi:Tubulin folding cofactor D C terminal